MEMAPSPDGRREEGSTVLSEEKGKESGQAPAKGYIPAWIKVFIEVVESRDKKQLAEINKQGGTCVF